MRITKISSITGIERTKNIPLNPEDYIKWKQGFGSISELIPYLNEDDVQFILSGIIKEEWASEFTKELIET